MDKRQLTLEQFYDWMDINKNGTISMVELRKGLTALNISLGQALQIMKIFDVNQNGQIEINEFYEAFGPDYQKECNDIILKRAAKKLQSLFILNKLDFVSGMKKLLFSFNDHYIISREEFLLAMDNVKGKANLSEGEIMKLMEFGDEEKKN